MQGLSHVRTTATRTAQGIRSTTKAARLGAAAVARRGVERLEQRTLFTVFWDGGGDGVEWTDPLNWSENALPGPSDDVFISVAANPTVEISSGVQAVRSLSSDEALTINGGTLSVAASSTLSAPLALSAGGIDGAGDLTLNTAVSTWSGGSMTGTGRTVVGGGGARLELSGGAHHLGRVLDNTGVIQWTAGDLTLDGGTLNNGRTVSVNGPVAVTAGAGGGTFNNNAPGFITVGPAGRLQLNAPGTNAARVSVATTASTVTFNADYTHHYTAAFEGPGAVNFAGGTQTFAAGPQGFTGVPLRAATANLTGGTLTGPGDFIVEGTLNWTGGTMTGAGRTVVGSNGGVVNLSGGAHALGRALDNGGTVNWSAGDLTVGAGGAFNNNRTLNVTGDVSVGGAGAFNNNSGSSGRGFVAVGPAGAAAAGAGLTVDAPGTSAGTYFVGTGATLSFAGDHTHAYTAAYDGEGAVNFAGGTQTFAAAPQGFTGGVALRAAATNLTGGTIDGPGNLTVERTLEWTGGAMAGAGPTVVGSSGTLKLSGGGHQLDRVLDNNGTVNWSAGPLTLGAGGTFNNNRTLNVTGSVAVGIADGVATAAVGGFNNSSGSGGRGFAAVGPAGASLTVDAPGTSAGTYFVGTGAALAFNGDHAHAYTAAYDGEGSLTVGGGTQTFTAAPQGFTGGVLLRVATMNLTGGTLTGPGDFTTERTLNWTGGVMTGTGRAAIGTSGGAGTLNLLGENPHQLDRALLVAGTINWTSGDLALGAGGAVTNNGTVNWTDGDLLLGTGGTFNNNRTVNVRGPVSVSGGAGSAFNNNSGSSGRGFVAVGPAGAAAAGAGLTVDAPGTSAGTYFVGPTAALTFSGDHTHAYTAAYDGDGALHFTGGTQTLAAAPQGFTGGVALRVLTTNLTGGTLTGPGDLTVERTLDWTGGVMTGPGRTVVGSSGTLKLSGGDHRLERVLDNNGTVNWSAGPLTLGTGGTFNNNRTLNVTGNVSVAGTGAFNNNSGSAGRGFLAIGPAGAPAGAGLTVNAPGTSAGTYFAGPGAALTFNGDHTHAYTAAYDGDGALNFAGGTQTFAAAPQGFTGGVTLRVATTNLTGGTVDGPGSLMVERTLNWTGGAMAGTGRTIVGPSGGTGTLNLSNGAHGLGRVLDNNGTVNWTAGALTLGAGGTFNNNRTLRVDGSVSVDVAAGAGAAVAFNNNSGPAGRGSVTVGPAGAPAGASLTVNAPGTSAGTYFVGAGAALTFNGDHTHAHTATVDGAGTLNFAGGTQTFAAGPQGFTGGVLLRAATTNLAGGTIAGPGDVAVGNLNWTGGAMTGTGRTVIASGAGTLNLPGGGGGGSRVLGRVLDNHGTVNWTAGDLALAAGGTFNNYRNVNVNGSVSVDGAGDGRAFNNKAPEGLVTLAPGVTFEVNTDGTNAARFYVNAGATLSFNGDYTHAAGSRIDGPGTVNAAAVTSDGRYRPANDNLPARVIFAGGTQTFAGDVVINIDAVNTATLQIGAGTVTFEGSFTQTAGAIVLDGGDVTALSTFTVEGGTVGGEGTVTADYTQTADSRLDVRLNGSAPGAEYDQLAVTGTISLAGELNVSLGFSPAQGAEFVVVNNDGDDAVRGTFAGLAEGATVTAGPRELRISYAGGDGNDVTLTAVDAPAAVVGRHVFYNNSAYDTVGDNGAIAPGKTALLPGGTLGPANVTSYSKGINGVMIDMTGLGADPSLAAADFLFRTSTGTGTDPGTWVDAPVPTVAVDPGAGVGGSDRVVFTWADGAIKNQWLQVTAPAGARTWLAAADVFSFGNLIGDADGSRTVNLGDFGALRQEFGRGGGLAARADFNRDGNVNLADFGTLRANFNKSLPPPPAAAAAITTQSSTATATDTAWRPADDLASPA